MNNKILKIAVIVMFTFGLGCYIISGMATYKANLLSFLSDIHTANMFSMLGNACLAAAIIGATQVKEN